MEGECRRPITSERATLDPFEALAGDVRPREQRDLMERPFFSLAKAQRVRSILYQTGDTQVQVYAVPEHGMATIWDADVLIWAASLILTAQDRSLPTSRFFRFTPCQLLIAVGRATGSREYQLLKGALTRLQSTVVRTTIRHGKHWRRQQFSWVNEWEELTTRSGRSEGMEFVLPEWLYRGVLDRWLVLAIDPAYFALTGGIELWLYRSAQARRPPTRRMALRTRASPYQERELGAVLRLRARYSDASSPVSCCRAMRLRLNAMTIAASSWSCGQAFPQELWESCGFRQSISGLRARQYRDFGWDRSEQRANVRLPSRFADPDTWTPYARNNAVNEQLEGPLIRRTAQRPASRRLGAAASGADGDRYRRRAARPCTSAPTTVT
jgi:hypothetical protein